LLMVGTKAVGVWKKVLLKVTKKGQDHVSDFTPFVWRDPAPGNRVANLVPVTGFTVWRHGRVKLAIQTRSISICLVKLEGVEKYRTRKPPHMYHSTILPTEACRGALSFFLVNVSFNGQTSA